MDQYKVDIINRHIEAMRKDEYALVQLKGPGDVHYINLDEGALELLADYYGRPVRYDVALMEVPLDAGINQQDIRELCGILSTPDEEEQDLIPMEVTGENSAALGFIRRASAEEIAYNYGNGSKFYGFIASILDDMSKESGDGNYQYRFPGRIVNIWMNRK